MQVSLARSVNLPVLRARFFRPQPSIDLKLTDSIELNAKDKFLNRAKLPQIKDRLTLLSTSSRLLAQRFLTIFFTGEARINIESIDIIYN